MFRILLVEDEKMELDTLKNYVNWEACGIGQVYTARGARSALECINSTEIDIMITDIQMPGMSGIELARIVREEGYDCKIVFLTGFDRFDYAKEAISLHAEEYLLKPFQIEEVENLVTNLVLKIESERQEKKMKKMAIDRIMDQACRGELQDADNLAKLYFHKTASEVHFYVLGIYGIEEADGKCLLDMGELQHCLWMDPFWIVIYPVHIAKNSMIQRIQTQFKDKELKIVYCEQALELGSLFSKVHRILVCKDDLFYKRAGAIMKDSEHRYRKVEQDARDISEEKKMLLDAIQLGDEENARILTDQCIDMYLETDTTECRQNAFSLFLYIHNYLEKKGNIDSKANTPNILQAKDYYTMKKNLENYVQQCCELCRERMGSKLSHYVRKFVHMHYMEPCTVEEMAEGINLSPNYLRKKFKEETGMTILEYVTEERLGIACDLLKDPSRRVKDVATLVGYDNISYFTQLFAKKYGVTPNEYRKLYS